MSEKIHVLITGAARGIGRAIAESFCADAGHRLMLLDRDSDETARWVALAAPNADVRVHALDIGNPGDVAHLTDALQREHGHLDVLVNCAGICDENEPDDVETWQRVLTVNLHGSFHVTAKCLAWLRDGGRIVNIASILGRAGKVRNTAYCASKHGMLGMTKALALDLAPRHITVNAVLPAWIDTPMLQQELAVQAGIAGTALKDIQRNAKKKLPLKRFLEAGEVATMVQYLISPAAAGVTAQSFVIDGGAGLGM